MITSNDVREMKEIAYSTMVAIGDDSKKCRDMRNAYEFLHLAERFVEDLAFHGSIHNAKGQAFEMLKDLHDDLVRRYHADRDNLQPFAQLVGIK